MMEVDARETTQELNEIQKILPHRPPFLFVSRIISIETGRSAVAEYDVPLDLPIFEGHFPQEKILPGVIIIEMMAQTGALAILSHNDFRGKIAYLAGIESARFKRPVRPGETMRAETVIGPIRRRIGRAQGNVFVGGEEVARAVVLFAVPN
ncbi:MAG TPA: 3-hydroxyacyl-ACP dehydratase FabZ [Firmicutes bacterium]|nr:3-hydroxyacyl-ACP dehydratase FabZ [Candidatus Fermentithermobacillaceae bacterium]